MQSLTCIVCPIGCALEVSGSIDNLSVTGNKCPRGIVYAQEEIRAPKRVVTATVPVALAVEQNDKIDSHIKRIPVKTSSPCLREKIPALLQDIYKTKVALPVKAGDVLISNWNGTGVDVVATRSVSN